MNDNRFTEQEMAVCRNTDIGALAEAFGYTVSRHNNWQTLKEAKHIVIKGSNRYYDNYKNEWGDAVTFVQEHNHMSFPEAVNYLLELNGHVRDQPVQHIPQNSAPPKKEPVEFKLPEANEDNKRVFSYLRKRGIAYHIIRGFVDRGLLYEDKEHHNCVFVGRDAKDEPVFAYKRGTYDKDGIGFKGDVDGSNKDVGFYLPCYQDDPYVRVYESPIDLMSDMTMRRQVRSNAVALCGLYDGALETYLKDNPHIKNISLLLDNDKWGREAADRLKAKYSERGYSVRSYTPPKGKDWNEYLQSKNEKKRERSDAR